MSFSSLKSLLGDALQLSGASILCSLILSFLSAESGMTAAVDSWMAGILCFHSEFPQDSPSRWLSCDGLMSVTSFLY